MFSCKSFEKIPGLLEYFGSKQTASLTELVAKEYAPRMEKQCANEISKIEGFIREIADLIDSWDNLSAQLEAVKKVMRVPYRVYWATLNT